MKKVVLIGGIGGLLLLGVFVGVFVVQSSLVSATGTSAKHSAIAKTGKETPYCMPYQQGPAKQAQQHPSPCNGNVVMRSKGKGLTPTSTPVPTPKPEKPTPTLVPTQAPIPPTPRPTQALPIPTPTSAGSGNASGTTNEAQLTQNLFAQINSDRAAQGLSAYTWNGTLANGARQHSITMGQTSCGLSHQCPGEPAPCQRVTNEGIHWMACGENAGYTSAYPDAWTAVKQNIEQGMLSERPPNDGHRKNLLSSTFHQIGIGIYIDSKGVIWVTEDFTN